MYKNPIKAIHYFEKANELAIQNNRTLDIASNYYSIGYCSLEKGNFDHAIENYLKSVRLYIQMNDVKRLTNAYLSLSNVYSRAKKYPKAYEYLQMAEQQFGISNDSLQQCAIIQQKGNYFFQQKMFDSAQY
jgi:tetratricopeptide (TPR) repeat protein